MSILSGVLLQPVLLLFRKDIIASISTLVVAGFPTGIENMGGTVLPPLGGGCSKFDGGGELKLKSIHGGAWGVLKCCQKIPVKEFI